MNYETIRLQIANGTGLKLAAEIFKPQAHGTLPAVFIVHGFTGYKEEANLVDIADKLSRRGIVTVRFTASGFGDSEGSLEKDYRFSNYILDLESVYAAVRTLPYVDPSRVGVCGHSMGGKLAVLFAAAHPEVTRLCIISAPIHFFSTAYGAMKDSWRRSGYFEKVSGRDNRAIRIPYAYVLDADQQAHDVLAAAGEITGGHALVLAGKSDETVSWQDTKKIFDALGNDKQFLLMDTMDHWYKKHPEIMDTVHAPIVDFFAKYI
jgi:alpha-beta hydrolase superfamily lysophospholipase